MPTNPGFAAKLRQTETTQSTQKDASDFHAWPDSPCHTNRVPVLGKTSTSDTVAAAAPCFYHVDLWHNDFRQFGIMAFSNSAS